MKKNLIVIFIFFTITACNSTEQQFPKTIKNNNSNIHMVDGDDKAMNIAIETAKEKFDDFDRAFKSNKYDTSTFAIKLKFPIEKGATGEHIWLSYLTFKNGFYYGIIDNVPEFTTKIKEGQEIKVSKDKISDWMYSDNNGILKGGFTILVRRSRMTPIERKEYDSTFPFIIKE